MAPEPRDPYQLEQIEALLPTIRDKASDLRELLLANLVMLGEIPSPTFGEAERVRVLLDRFAGCGLQAPSSDEVGNGLGVLPGSLDPGGKNILLVAHTDDVYDATDDHTVNVETTHVIGTGVGDNAFGIATLASLPDLLEACDIKLRNNLVLMGASRSLGKGNLEGLLFFLENSKFPIDYGICVEGVQLGRLSYQSIGMLRGEIQVDVPKEYDWTRYGLTGAIQTMTEIITRISEIPLPRKPQSFVVMGSVESGTSYNIIPTKALLRFELRSDAAEVVGDIFEKIEDIAAEVSSQSRADVRVEAIARRHPGGIQFSHPLVKQSRNIMKSLDINPKISPSSSELAAFIDHGIPAITLGMTVGEEIKDKVERLQIDPMFTGMAQLIGTLLAIDSGLCDEE